MDKKEALELARAFLALPPETLPRIYCYDPATNDYDLSVQLHAFIAGEADAGCVARMLVLKADRPTWCHGVIIDLQAPGPEAWHPGEVGTGYQVIIRGEMVDDDGQTASLGQLPPCSAWWDLALPPCPDCGGRLYWFEAGYVPGTRKCDCGSLFSVQCDKGKAFVRRERMR